MFLTMFLAVEAPPQSMGLRTFLPSNSETSLEVEGFCAWLPDIIIFPPVTGSKGRLWEHVGWERVERGVRMRGGGCRGGWEIPSRTRGKGR